MNSINTVVQKLCTASEREFQNPFAMDWPQSVGSGWFMSPELLSVYGSAVYDELDDAERQRLSFLECINFFSLNIHGERMLVEGLATRLYRKKNSIISPYLHHFIDEENKHMVYFGNFCSRYAGKIYSDRRIAFPRTYEDGEEDFLFFAKVMIFEELADAYNVRNALDKRVHELARQINLMHHKDEARHLVFGRQIVVDLFHGYSAAWKASTLDSVRTYLLQYLEATFREYYNPDVYADFGFPDPYAVGDHAYNSHEAKEHRAKIAAPTVEFLTKNGILK